MSQQSERIEAAFNRRIIPALEDFTSRKPIPQPLLESLRGMVLVGFDMPGSNRLGSFSVIHDKFADLMREDPRGFKVIDFVTSSPEARSGRRNLAYSSNINNIITLGGKRFKRFYTELDEPQVQGAIS